MAGADSADRKPPWLAPGAYALAAGTIGCLALAVQKPGEFAAALLAWAAYLPLALSPRLRRDRWLAGAYFLVVTAHHALSLVNVYGAKLPGADLDPLWFHTNAASLIRHHKEFAIGIGTDAYIGLLGAAYRVGGTSLLLGQQLSVLASALACLALLGVMRVLGFADTRWQAAGVLLFGSMPSLLLYGTLTMREPYQVLFFVAGCLAALLARRDRSFRMLAASWLSFLAMGAFHEAMLLAAVFLTAMASALYFSGRPAQGGRPRATTVAVAVIVAMAAGFPVLKYAPALRGNSYLDLNQTNVIANAGKIGTKIARYRRDIERLEPRTSYGFEVRAAPARELWSGLARSWGYYLLGPVPGRVGGVGGAVLAVEALLRWFGLAALVAALLDARLRSPPLWFLTGAFLLVTAIWSIGTTNFGQAFRHQAMTNWIVLLFALAWLAFRRAPQPVVEGDRPISAR